MLKKVIKYTDYDGVEREESFYFNMSQAELAEMELSVAGGMGELIRKMVDEKDQVRLAEMFKRIILMSYGVKSNDGKRFMKSEELSREFTQTEAYSNLYMELISDAKAAADFVNGILPPKESINNIQALPTK